MTANTHSPDSVRRKRGSERFVAAIALIVTLIVGIVLGIALDRSVLWPRVKERHGPPGALRALEWRGNPADRRRIRVRMMSELGLTKDQADRIDTIMAHRSVAFQSVRTETEARVKAMLDTTRTMIDSILTPTQREKMKEIRAKRERGNAPPTSPPPEAGR